MRIVFYCTEQEKANASNFFNLATSGTVNDMILIAEGLSSCGHEVIVLNRSASGFYSGVQHFNTESEEQCLEIIHTIKDIDIFVANGWAAEIFLKHKIPAIKNIYWLHNFINIEPFENAIDCGNIDYIFCVSFAHMAYYWRSRHFNRFNYIFNPIKIKQFNNVVIGKRNKKKIMFIGAPRYSKGFHDALRIFQKVANIYHDCKLYVAGSATLHSTSSELGTTGLIEREYEDQFVKQYLFNETGQVKNNIVLLGKISRNELFEHLANTLLCLQNPSWTSEPEALSMSVVEAQAMGVPVVTAFRGGQDEALVDGKTGFLVKRNNDSSFVKIILKIIDDEQLSGKMSIAARKHAFLTYDHVELARQWAEQFDTLLNHDSFFYKWNFINAVFYKLRNKAVLAIP